MWHITTPRVGQGPRRAETRSRVLASIGTEAPSTAPSWLSPREGSLRSVLANLLIVAAIGATSWALVPAAYADHPSGSTVVQGQVQAVHEDFFAAGTSKDRYSLATPGGKSLKIKSRKDGLGLRDGARVTLRGQVTDGALAVTEESATAAAETQPTAAAALPARPVKVAVILLNFRDNTTQPFTAADARTTVFTGANSVNAYYQETSFGQINLTGKVRADGDVFGWYTSTRDAVGWITTSGEATPALAQQAGVDLSGYDKFIYVHPRITSCGWRASPTSVEGTPGSTATSTLLS